MLVMATKICSDTLQTQIEARGIPGEGGSAVVTVELRYKRWRGFQSEWNPGCLPRTLMVGGRGVCIYGFN